MNKCITASVYGVSLKKCLAYYVVIALLFYAAVTFLMSAKTLPKPKSSGIYLPAGVNVKKAKETTAEKETAASTD